MSVSTKLFTALAVTALLAASLVAANLYGVSVHLQWAVTLTMELLLAWAFVLVLSLTKDLRRIGAVCREIGSGRPASIAGTANDDDLAAIDAALTRNAACYQELASTLRQELEELIAQSSGMSSLAAQSIEKLHSASAIPSSAGAGIKTLALNAATIASRFERLNAGMGTATNTASESAAQVGMIIGATEKMSATIADIAINAEKARGVAGTAVSNVNAASNRVDELGAAALEINKVTDVIVEIAEQTKLLALNATIEAARAGEAGKGFAVVANEVKELALQTNKAIAEIRNKVEAMQHSTDNTIAEIGAINQTIKALNEIVVTIAGAVDEQSIPAKDVVRQVNQWVNGINIIKEAVNAAAAEVKETSVNINKVATISQELAEEFASAAPRDEDLSPLLASIKQQSDDLQSTGEKLLAKIDREQL
ncbi:MAG: methyl-accepting chemotaxis protein [Desulfobulbaceae bacterium]|nr:methyl-accepting chemotaxis protein [Desulfobulbaceae bacterium]